MAYSGVSLPCSNGIKEGVSKVGIQQFTSALEASGAKMRGFVLLRNGKAVAQHYWPPYKAENKNWVYSISKSFTSTAVGMAFDEGLLKPDDLALSFFPELDSSNYSENAKAIRLRDLLSMTSGHDADPTVSLMFCPSSGWENMFFSTPVKHEPGTHFVYNSAASYLLSSVITRVTGNNAYEYLTPRLFEPLGFGDTAGDITPENVFAGGWGMMVCLEDLAKLGQLYLNRGIWNGKRLLSEEWISMATSMQSDNGAPHRANEPVDWRQGYGFQFWRCQNNAFRADGAAGQYCIVMPEQNAVLAMMSETESMQEIMDVVWDNLLPAINGMTSHKEEKLNGINYRLSAGADGGMRTAEFKFSKDSLLLTMNKENETFSLQSGRGDWLDGICGLPIGEVSFVPMMSLNGMAKKIASHFYWKDENTLEIVWVYLESPHRGKIICRFENEKVGFYLCSSLSSNNDDENADFTGRAESI